MRISSASASCFDHDTDPSGSLDHTDAHIGATIARLWQWLDRHLSAIAHAEAGDFDAVREILDQGRAPLTGHRPGHIVWDAGQA